MRFYEIRMTRDLDIDFDLDLTLLSDLDMGFMLQRKA